MIRTWLSRIVPLLSLTFIVYFVISKGSEVNWSLLISRPVFMLWGIASSFGVNLVAFACWQYSITRKVPALDLVQGYRIYAMPLLSRYLPGGQVWQYIGFYQSTSNHEIGTYAAAAYAQCTLGSLFAGLMLFVAGLPEWYAISVTQIIALEALLLFSLWIACLPQWQNRFLAAIRKKIKAIPTELSIRFQNCLWCIAGGAVCWALGALTASTVYWGIHQEVSWSFFWMVLCCYSAATFAAYFTFLTPGGVGVREGLFVALLTRHVPLPEAGLMALFTAINYVLCDFTFVVPFLISLIRKRAYGE